MKLELLVSRYARMIGLARYTLELQKGLSLAGVDFATVETHLPLLLQAGHTVLHPFGYDLRAFFNIFPVSAPLSRDAVKHLTTQMMASLYTFQPGLRKVVITVHDIIPYMLRDDPAQNVYRHFYDRLVDERAMQDIRRADRIIVVSAFTGQMLVEKLGCPPARIRLVPEGIDHQVFRPVEVSAAFRLRFGIEPGRRYLLYVGSENPRKNLPRLVQALEKVKRELPQVCLIKVGTPQYLAQSELLKNQIHAAGLDENVLFIDHVSQEDLISLYSAADVFVFPSLYEGFGLPPLEAMACGAPVICSNSSSLPEVVGDAALQVDPYDVDTWGSTILQVLEDEPLRQELRSRSLARAAQFTWERTVQQTLAVYQEVDNAG